jgi:CRISPR/Cas system-associated endonuclease Cas1
MKKHLNTLFVTTQEAYLAKDGETVAVRIEGKVRLRVPVHTLDSIVCFGNVSASPFLMGFCAEQDVSLSFCTEHGRFLARVVGPVSGNVLLRREQYRRADELSFCAAMARSCLTGKVANCRYVLQRPCAITGTGWPTRTRYARRLTTCPLPCADCGMNWISVRCAAWRGTRPGCISMFLIIW